MSLNRLWTSHLKDKEEKEKFRREIQSAFAPLERLTEICQKKRKESDSLKYSQESIDKFMPGGGFRDWLMYQAGRQSAFAEIEAITNITTE